MKRILYFLIGISFVLNGGVKAQQFSVGDTATFKYYDAGFFSGFYSAKYMCRAVSDNAYIFSEEEPYKITGVYTGSGQVIVYDPARLQFFKLGDNGWSSFGVSGVKFSGKADIKTLGGNRYHFYAVASDGAYVFNGSSWTKKIDRKDIIDVAASPLATANITQYLPYFLAKFSIFTTNRNYMGSVRKLPVDLFLDEGFEPEYGEDTTLSEWTVSGNVSVNRSIISGQQYYVISLTDNASATKNFTLNASLFKFRVIPVITNTDAQASVDFLTSDGAQVFSIEFKNDSLFIGDTLLSELSRYAISKVWGIADIANNNLEVYLGDSLLYSDTAFTFGGQSVAKLTLSVTNGTIYFDELNVVPVASGIYGYPSSKNAFYLATSDGIYVYNSGSWSKIFDGNVASLYPIDDNTLYALTDDNLIVKTNDGGVSWDTLPNTTLSDVYEFTVNPDNADMVIAVGTPGVVEYSDGSWRNISDSLLNWSPPEFVDTIYAAGFKDGSTLVLGTGQGVFMSEGSIENLVEKNTGILKSFITNEQVQLLAQYVDSAYVTMNSFFNGLARDIDNDPRVVVLAGDLSPKLTSGETKIIPILGVMNPELNYVEDANHPYGDGHEVIEIDVYDDSLYQYISSAHETWKYATYRAMAKLFFWTHDTEEETWMIEGMGGIGEYLAKYNVGDPDTGEYKISPLYSLKKIEESPYKVDMFVASLNRPYLFLLHLWSKYGLQSLQSIYTDATIPSSTVGLARISRIVGVSQNDLYKEWVLDVFRHENMDLTPNVTINFIEKLFPPQYGTRQTYLNWSFGGFSIELTQGDTLGYLRFNGVNSNGVNLFDVYYKLVGDTVVNHVTGMDSHGDKVITGLTNVAGQDTTVYNFIVFFADSELADNAALTYAVKKDTVTPSIEMGYFQNSLADQNVSVYLFTDEQLFDEVIDTIPSLELISGTDTSVVDFSVFDTFGDTTIYSLNFTIANAGKIYLKAELQDYAGNAVELTDSVLAWYLQSGGKLTFTGFNGEILLEIPENALSISGYAIYSITSGRYYRSPNSVYVFPNVSLRFPARIELGVPDNNKRYHVYVWYDGTWHDMGGVLSATGNKVIAYINKLGPVTLMQADSAVPSVFSIRLLGSPVILTGKVSFEVSIPKSTDLSVKIFNYSGREVKELFNGHLNAGKYNFSWRVESLRDGVYFIVVKDLRSGMRFTQKVVKF